MRAIGVTQGVLMTQHMRQHIYNAAGLTITANSSMFQLDQRIYNGVPLDYPALIEAHTVKRITKALVGDDPDNLADD